MGDFAHFMFTDHPQTDGNITQIERRFDLHKLVKTLAKLIDVSFRHFSAVSPVLIPQAVKQEHPEFSRLSTARVKLKTPEVKA